MKRYVFATHGHLTFELVDGEISALLLKDAETGLHAIVQNPGFDIVEANSLGR